MLSQCRTTIVGMIQQNRKDLIVNTKKRNVAATATAVQTSLDSYFGSVYQQYNSNTVSKKRASSIDPTKKYISTVRNILSSKSPSAFGTCPICNNRNIPIHRLAIHASQCNGTEQQQQQQQQNLKYIDNNNSNIESSPVTLLQQSSRVDTQHQADGTVVGVATTPSSSLIGRTIEQVGKSAAFDTPLPNLPYTEPVPGLYVYENFLTEYEEAQILTHLGNNNKIHLGNNNKIDPHNIKYSTTSNAWKAATFNGKHYGQRWGVHCNLRTRQVLPEERSLPKFYNDYILPKLQKIGGNSSSSTISSIIKGCAPNEMNAIDYHKSLGHSLSAHVDDRHLSKEVIMNLSLAGDCYMTFTPVGKPRASSSLSSSKPSTEVRVLLQRRCLQIMTGPARYQYTHGIYHNDLLNERRVSLTIRESPITTAINSMNSSVTTSNKTETTTQDVTAQNRKHPVTYNIIVATKPSSITSLSWVKSDCAESFRSLTTIIPIGKAILNQVSLDVPPGLYIFPNFITKQQEEELINQLDKSDSIPLWSIERHTGIHREKRWGVDHDIWSRQVRAPVHTIPDWIESNIIHRLQLLRLQSEDNDSTNTENDVTNKFSTTMRSFGPNDVNAIEYKRDNGHFLGAHIDDRQKHTEPIANLSLVGNCYMEYTLNPIKKLSNVPRKGSKSAKTNPTEGSETAPKELYRVHLPRRSLQILTGRARYDYRHGIHNSDLSSERRISITLRETRP